MRFRNQANGYEEDAELCWFWTLLGGPIYFAVRGIWTHAVVSVLAVLCTFGISWLVYPLFASRIVRRHYLGRGWVEVRRW